MIKVDVPIFEHKLISSGKTIKCRPFLVKEEKLLLMAMESNDPHDLLNTTIQVIENCVLDDIDIGALPYYDVEYLILDLRAKSIGDHVQLSFVCNNEILSPTGDLTKTCGHHFTAPISISDVAIHKEDMKDGKITFPGDMGMQMKYPSYQAMKLAAGELDTLEQKIDLLSQSVEALWDKDTVYKGSTLTKQDITDFIENLTKEDFNKMQDFVDGAPWLRIEKVVECPKCHVQNEVTYEGFESFFA